MHRIDSPNRQLNKFGSGKDGFTEGTPGSGTLPTETTDDWLDDVQEELITPIENMGIALVKNTRDQFLSALKCMEGRVSVLGPWGGMYNSQAGGLNAIHYDETFDEWVAVGAALGATPYILHSLNGTDWYRGGAAVRTGAKNYPLNGVACSGSLWVAAGDYDGVDAYVLTSPDGLTWTERTLTAVNIYDVIWGASHSLFVMCGSAGQIHSSSDGTTWAYVDYGSQIFLSLAYSGTTFVVCGNTGELRSSTAGDDSYISRTSGTTVGLKSVTYSSELGRFCVVGEAETDNIPVVLTSDDDGITWTRRTTGLRASNNTLFAVKWLESPQLFIAAGYHDQTHEMYVSADAITWEEINPLSNQAGNVADTIRDFSHNPSNGLTVCCGDVWGATMATLFRTSAIIQA